MREIKFRAWLHGGGDSRIKGSMTYYEPTQIDFWKRLDGWDLSYELMQFTGLLDKNGKEIYEGDILSGEKVVEWNDEYAGFGFWEKSSFGRVFRPNRYGITQTLEVIGNIYENPELLEEKGK